MDARSGRGRGRPDRGGGTEWTGVSPPARGADGRDAGQRSRESGVAGNREAVGPFVPGGQFGGVEPPCDVRSARGRADRVRVAHGVRELVGPVADDAGYTVDDDLGYR